MSCTHIFEYPQFRLLRAAVKDQAELLAISSAGPVDITYGSDQEMEKGYRQYVSGWTFGTFGLKPALGRLLTASDEAKPGAHPYAVLSYEYWTRRFGQDPKVLGRTFRQGLIVYEIVGVCERGFTGTETGAMTDFFVPTMMNARAIDNPNWGWFRTWVRINPGVSVPHMREVLQASMTAHRREKVKSWNAGIGKQRIEMYIHAPLQLEPASAGVSGYQGRYRRPLAILGVVVLLVLLIACANVANLMTAQAASRAKEMALRVSIGAGRMRLLQLVLVESGLIALFATLLGGLFAMWAAPFVVSMINPSDSPAKLALPADWRVLGFAAILAAGVTVLFGIGPAVRASSVKPMMVLRGGEQPHSRRRVMHLLTAAQMAFCIMVLFVTGLFLTTIRKLQNQSTGFAVDNVITLDAGSNARQPFAFWDQVTEHLRSIPGVEAVGASSWALMSGNGLSSPVRVGGEGRNDLSEPYFLNVTPKWLETMKIPLLDGRDFRADDTSENKAIVNEAFAKRYFKGENPVGRSFEVAREKDSEAVQIVGYVRDARYRDIREEIRPTAYIPFRSAKEPGEAGAAIIVRTAASVDPLRLASILRQEVPRARSEFRVGSVRTQRQLVQLHMIRERLLAALSLFFAVVALLLAGVGLFGVIQYAMLQRRREIGIRMALGARAADVVRRVTVESFAMLGLGALAGLIAGMLSTRFIESLLFDVKGSEPSMIAAPALILLATALLAALPPVAQAVRIDPALMLRSE